ncbi:MAG: methylated-DNA--[protein]-cysteine S-methyltransferase [Muribaculaceae bacterium]|nr:methylated-DNA--[protein]-cysteine S-methyltransferase [Muribaculaceae bacterium]
MIETFDYEVCESSLRIGTREGEIIFVGFPLLSGKGRGSIDWLEKKFKDNVIFSTNQVIKECAYQIKEYLRGERYEFELPVKYEGTHFQKEVWKAIDRIPYGMNVTYSELARKIGCVKGMQAVGNAVGANPISIITPCHRVVAKKGPGGYAWGLDMKNKLLSLERLYFSAISSSFTRCP